MEPKLYKSIMDWKLHQKLTEPEEGAPRQTEKQLRWNTKARDKNFELEDGVLKYWCRRRSDREPHLAKVVTSAAEASALFNEFHCSSIGGHCGGEKTHKTLIERFYWPGMKKDIMRWVAECPSCQVKRGNLKAKTQYNPISVKQPFELVGMDLMSLTESAEGHKYVCVIVDYFTKWAEAYPLKSKDAVTVTACILDYVYKWGVPFRLLTDQGSEFRNQVNRRLCEELDIERSFSAPYHPQTNGQVEKMNHTIQRSLTALCAESPKTWDKKLQATMFAIRTKPHYTTTYSAYYLMLGREARYPAEVPEHYDVTPEMVEDLVMQEEVFEGLKRQPAVYEAVRANVQKQQDKVRKRKLEQGWNDDFAVGDVVLKKNIREEQRKGGKMAPAMLGPFTITDIKEKVVYLVGNKQDKHIANLDQLSRYIEPEERIPAKLKRAETSSLARPPPPLSPLSHPPVPHPPQLQPSPSSSLPDLGPAQPSFSPSGPPPALHQSPSGPSTDPPPVGSGKDHKEVLHTVWGGLKGHVLWAKVDQFKVHTMDLFSLAPGQKVHCEIIDAYLALVAQKAKRTIKVLPVREMTLIWESKTRGVKKIDPLAWDLIVGAVLKDEHYTLVVMHPKEGRTIYVDPFGASPQKVKHCEDATRAYMRRMRGGGTVPRWHCETASHPRQRDPTSCGVFVCKIAEELILGTVFSAEDLSVTRASIGIALMEDSDDLADLCRYCGDHEVTTGKAGRSAAMEWIECECCSKWFHFICLGNPSREGFLCPACV